MLAVTLVLTWLNQFCGDFYLITLPISVVTFGFIICFMSHNDSYDYDRNLTQRVESLEDEK